MIHWTTKSSNTFERHEVRATGRRSLSQVISDAFGIGDIHVWASLHAEGKSPDDNDWLKIVVTGSENSDANSFRIRFGIASGPQALKGLSPSSFL